MSSDAVEPECALGSAWGSGNVQGQAAPSPGLGGRGANVRCPVREQRAVSPRLHVSTGTGEHCAGRAVGTVGCRVLRAVSRSTGSADDYQRTRGGPLAAGRLGAVASRAGAETSGTGNS